MSDEERARKIADEKHARALFTSALIGARLADSDIPAAFSDAILFRIASALSAVRDEERDRIVARLRKKSDDGYGLALNSVANAIAASRHREPKT